jgi:hypothetical protein
MRQRPSVSPTCRYQGRMATPVRSAPKRIDRRGVRPGRARKSSVTAPHTKAKK